MHLAATDAGLVERVRAALTRHVHPGEATLESAAGVWASAVYEALEPTLLLSRVFAVLPRGALPARERSCADRLAGAEGVPLDEASPVLTLMATRGAEPAWNDRARSQDHLAIPLACPACVDGAPMVASLLRDLGAEVRRAPDGAARLVADAASAGAAGTFYVFDAATSVDERGRLTIPARDFVRDHDVRTVLGVGGTHGASPLFALILFARQHVTRRVADELVPLAAEFVALTRDAVASGRLFTGGQ